MNLIIIATKAAIRVLQSGKQTNIHRQENTLTNATNVHMLKYFFLQFLTFNVQINAMMCNEACSMKIVWAKQNVEPKNKFAI